MSKVQNKIKDKRYRDYKHFFCICCGKPTKPIHYNEENVKNQNYKLESEMYSDSIVDSIAAGYGSTHDGNVYYISVCDECATKAIEDGRLAYKSNYMGMEPLEKDIEKWNNAYDKRVRDVNIGDLLK